MIVGRNLCLATVLVFLTLISNGARSAEGGGNWLFGIGSGLVRLNADGDVGFDTPSGPGTGKVDLDPSDFNDLIDSAFGFSAFAAKGPWNISIGYGNMTLRDKDSVELGGGLPPLTTDFKQDITFGEAAVTYQFAQTNGHLWGVLGGVRWMEHDYDVRLGLGAAGVDSLIKEDWTDVVVGLTHTYPLSQRWVWSSRLTAGFGGSENYWSAHTQIGWQFARSWNLGAFFDFRKIEFENGSPGDADWYLYDADEWGPGISIAYVWGG
jgi:hypothetical protein